MARVYACGCTYRADPRVDLPGTPESAADERVLRREISAVLADGPRTWGALCLAFRVDGDSARDRFHLILHQVATPTITPVVGVGRKGTTWALLGGAS